jgi:hypothetical protein
VDENFAPPRRNEAFHRAVRAYTPPLAKTLAPVQHRKNRIPGGTPTHLPIARNPRGDLHAFEIKSGECKIKRKNKNKIIYKKKKNDRIVGMLTSIGGGGRVWWPGEVQGSVLDGVR